MIIWKSKAVLKSRSRKQISVALTLKKMNTMYLSRNESLFKAVLKTHRSSYPLKLGGKRRAGRIYRKGASNYIFDFILYE